MSYPLPNPQNGAIRVHRLKTAGAVDPEMAHKLAELMQVLLRQTETEKGTYGLYLSEQKVVLSLQLPKTKKAGKNKNLAAAPETKPDPPLAPGVG